MTVLEIADIRVKPENSAAFEAAVAEAVPLFRAAPGCESLRLERSIEQPGRYLLVVGWATIEAHTVDFRGSEAFTAWRGLVGQYFAAPPHVEHVERVLEGF